RLERIAAIVGVVSLWQKAVEETARTLLCACDGVAAAAEALEVGAFAGGEMTLLFAEQGWKHEVVVAVGENGGFGGEEFGEGAVFVDGEMVDDGLHGEGHTA